MGELLKLTPTYKYTKDKLELKAVADDHFLFEGDSCYPISPCEEMLLVADEGRGVYSQDDQIAKIVDKLETLKEDDKEFIDAKSKHSYLEYFEDFVANN